MAEDEDLKININELPKNEFDALVERVVERA